MLRYIERSGLVAPPRSESGYRLYGPAELQRLRTLRELLDRFGIGLGDVGFAQRMRTDADLSVAIESWLESQARRPEHVPAADWLLFEQEKHERLLSATAAVSPPLKEAG
jgi:DNA-binding transcriptional MerR regulator